MKASRNTNLDKPRLSKGEIMQRKINPKNMYKSEVNDGNSTDGPLIFNWDSDYRKNHMEMYKNQTERQIMMDHGYGQVFDSGVIRWEFTDESL